MAARLLIGVEIAVLQLDNNLRLGQVSHPYASLELSQRTTKLAMNSDAQHLETLFAAFSSGDPAQIAPAEQNIRAFLKNPISLPTLMNLLEHSPHEAV